jgi:hypothetical protein
VFVYRPFRAQRHYVSTSDIRRGSACVTSFPHRAPLPRGGGAFAWHRLLRAFLPRGPVKPGHSTRAAAHSVLMRRLCTRHSVTLKLSTGGSPSGRYPSWAIMPATSR